MGESTPPSAGSDEESPRSYGGHIDGPTDSLKLRPTRFSDEEAVRAAHAQLDQEDFEFALGLRADMSWGQYLELLEQRRLGALLDADDVAATFLLADVGGEIVGRTSIRHHLNDRYRHGFGHIGYAVLPNFRGHGYATQILNISLVLASQLGIESALLVCDAGNFASIAVIERNGGQFESTRMLDGTIVRRYWIDLSCQHVSFSRRI
jgi:predicted acetyltransferase